MKHILEVQTSQEETNYCCGWADGQLGAVLVTAETLDQLKKNFKEALELHIDGCKRDGDPLPDYLAKGEYEIRLVMQNKD